jgi:excisionase family DNA binding protein
MTVKPEGLSIQTVAALLDVHENTIRNWIKAGYIKAVRTGPHLIRIPRDEVVRIRVECVITTTHGTTSHNPPQ